MVSGINLLKGTFVSKTLTDTTMEECLVECLKKSDCRSAFFNPKTRICRLAVINRHTVRIFDDHFVPDSGWNMYENNCIQSK
ncbi:MAG: hypothetical protein GY696_35925 [Gammaproteobacteria bacterium]|nr:hypothetical protein [Gammaproteobacteria bacterium]